MTDTEKQETEELPRIYMLPVTKEQLEYLTIGLTANASFLQESKSARFAIEWQRSIASWCLAQLFYARKIEAIHNDLNGKMAKLLGAEQCPDCGNFHIGGSHE